MVATIMRNYYRTYHPQRKTTNRSVLQKVLLVLGFFLLATAIAANSHPEQTIHVRPGSEVATLQQALELAEAHAEIIVHSGTYTEIPVLITKPVTIRGEGWPVLDGQGKGQIMLITSNHVNIEGLEIRNTGMSHIRDHAGIRVENAKHVHITGNRLRDTFFGIYLAKTDSVQVAHNDISARNMRESNSGNGIHLWDSRYAMISDNHIRGHRDGIYLEFADHAQITGNISESNIRYGLHYMFTKHSVYSKNVFRNNGAGVAVMYSHHVVMNHNRFTDNWGAAAYGLLLKDITDSEVSENVFRQNTIAIFSEGSARVNITRNIISNNGYAVKIMASSQSNVFEANNFIENTFDVVTNSTRNFNTFQRNYWSRYEGYDLTGDGFGDVPYRPVRLYSVIVEQHPAALILMRSFFIDLLDLAERVIPVLTPETLLDDQPLMKEVVL